MALATVKTSYSILSAPQQNNVYYYHNSTGGMRLKSITIENLRSFENSEFNFKEYNVIVGSNNSGKTNLLRILRMLTSDELLSLGITQEMKFKQGKKSQVKLVIETTDSETKMILQVLMDRFIESEKISESWKHIVIILSWQGLGNNAAPYNVTFYFQSGVAVTFRLAEHTVFYCPSFNTENPEQFLDEMCSLTYGEVVNKTGVVGADTRIRDEGQNMGQMTSEELLRFFGHAETGYTGNLKGERITCSHDEQRNHVLELVDYMGLELRQNLAITPLKLVHKIMRDSFISVEEMHPDYRQLTEDLFNLKSEDDHAYEVLKESFGKIFNGMKITVEQSRTDGKEKTIWIIENKKRFKIEDSASGYLEAIYILYKILNSTDCVIFLDEPEIHFHPIKIRQMGRMLLRLTEDGRNQIIIISHSPKFVDHRLLTPDSSSALIVVTKNENKSLVASPENPNMELKPHLLDPDVFFANAVFLVEGSSDESVIRAISNNFGGVFDSYEITVVNCGGVKGMKPYAKLLKAYSIVYYGLADKEYGGESSIVKLDVDLESELQKIIPEIEEKTKLKKTKLKAEDAYYYTTNLLKTKDGFEKLKKTAIWTSVKNAADKTRNKPQDF